jgi:hypothetical protein
MKEVALFTSPTRTSRNWILKIEDWRFVVSLRSVYYIKIDRLTFILFLFLFLRVRFLVSVFRIWDCVYLSWHLTPETKFAEQKRSKKLTPTFIFVNACIPRVYKETEKYFALFAQNWIDNCLKWSLLGSGLGFKGSGFKGSGFKGSGLGFKVQGSKV